MVADEKDHAEQLQGIALLIYDQSGPLIFLRSNLVSNGRVTCIIILL